MPESSVEKAPHISLAYSSIRGTTVSRFAEGKPNTTRSTPASSILVTVSPSGLVPKVEILMDAGSRPACSAAASGWRSFRRD